jgi:4'-phosphopantetheinyl transferase EntD
LRVAALLESEPLPLARLFDAKVGTAVLPPMLVDDQLYPEEQTYIARAVEKRRAEFGTARLCARHALAQLGYRARPLVPYPDRSPCWPLGVVGSISHSRRFCAAVVSSSPHVRALGLDVEDDDPLASEIEDMVCTRAELGWLRGHTHPRRPPFGKLFFSAKEAFYKCQYVVTGMLLDFQDVELSFDHDWDGRVASFRVTRVAERVPMRAALLRVEGRYLHQSGQIATGVTLKCA